MGKGGDGRIQVAKTRLNLRQKGFGDGPGDCVVRQISYVAMRLIERVSLVAKTGVSRRQVVVRCNIGTDR